MHSVAVNLLASALSLSFLTLSTVLWAQSDPITTKEEIIISASRSEQLRTEAGSSVSIINKEQIEQSQSKSVIDALKLEPTLDIASTGGKGSSTSVSIRGANPEHTLVILDDIELNNPILPGRSFNFADLLLNNVDRIEILRGPQSTIYGSDAMGGVINIISEASNNPFSFNSSFEAGSYSTFSEQISLGAARQNSNYSLSVAREDSAGISSADSRYGNSEDDGHNNTNYLGRAGFTLDDSKTKLNSILHVIDSEAELDNYGGASGDDLNRLTRNEQYFWGSSLSSSFLNDHLDTSLTYKLSDQSFRDDNDPDALSSEFLRSKYSGQINSIALKSDYRQSESTNIIAGAESEQESGDSNYSSDGTYGPYENDFTNRSARTNSYYLQVNSGLTDELYVNNGIRLDDFSEFGSETTYRIAPSYLLKEFEGRVFGSYGSGFKAPSLFQLYSSYGNQNLEAEKSSGFDIGIEKFLCNKRLQLSITYFNQQFDNLIDFDPNTFLFSNISSARTSGIENSLTAGLFDWLNINLAYTYLDATNQDTGRSLLRRARNKISSTLTITPSENAEIGIQTNYRSSRADNNFSTFPVSTEVLSGYAVTNLLASYKLSKNLQIYARVENLFDRNYQEVLGYGTYGISSYAGLRYTL